MKPVHIHSLPDTRCLEALRDACQRVLGPELQTPLAKHYLNLLGMVLNRWHAASSRLPAIESQLGHLSRPHFPTLRCDSSRIRVSATRL